MKKKRFTLLCAVMLALVLALAMPFAAYADETEEKVYALQSINTDGTDVTDLGGGRYNVKGAAGQHMFAQFEPVGVTENSVVHVAVTMHGYASNDKGDTWMSVMLGSDAKNGQYGPNQGYNGKIGPVATFLLRFYDDGRLMGNTFDSNVTVGSIPDIAGVSDRLEFVFEFSAGAVSVTLCGVKLGSYSVPQSVFADGAFFGFRTHGAGTATAEYNMDVRIADRATAPDVNYDIAVKPDIISVPVVTAGSEILDVSDENGQSLINEFAEITDGYIKLKAQILGTPAEGDKKEFIIKSSKGDSRFAVNVTDTTVITFSEHEKNFDFANPEDVTFNFNKHTLTDIKLWDASGITEQDYTLTENSLTFKKEYLKSLGYGEYEFLLYGLRASGIESAKSAVKITVADSRMPQIERSKIEIDAANVTEINLKAEWYDGKFTSLISGGNPVPNSGYTVNDAGITFTAEYIASLEYGETEYTLVTSKNEIRFVIVKEDSRTASIASLIKVDKADIGEYFDIRGEWYGETVTSVTLNGKEVEFFKTLRSVRLSGEFVSGLPLGEHELKVITNLSVLTATVNVTDSRKPVRTDNDAFDADFPYDVTLKFELFDNKLKEVKRGGNKFEAAQINGNEVKIPRGWLTQINLSAGDETAFELVYVSAAGDEKSVTVTVKAVSSRLKDLGEYELSDGYPFAFAVTLNHAEIERVRIGNKYYPFVYADGKVIIQNSALEQVAAGETQVTVETNRYHNAGVVKFTDNRRPEIIDAKEYTGGDYALGVKTYAYSVTKITLDGKEIAKENYTVNFNEILLKETALFGINDGNHLITITAEKSGAADCVFDFMFTAVTPQKPVISEVLSYELSDGGTLGVNMDFKNNLAINAVLLNGEELDKSLWRTVAYGSLILGEGAFSSLKAGEYTFTVVCDRESADFTVIVTDSRVKPAGGKNETVKTYNVGASVGIGIGAGIVLGALVFSGLILFAKVKGVKANKEE